MAVTVFIPMLIGGAIMSIAMLIVAAVMPGNGKRYNRRLQAIRGYRLAAVDPGSRAGVRRTIATNDSGANRVASLLPRREQMLIRLSRTGKSVRLDQYIYACAAVALLVFAMGLLAGFPVFLDLWLAVGVGVGLPHMLVSQRIAKRQAAFITKFPDAIDLIVRGVRSGLPVSETITVVGREVDGPVGEEFQRITDRIRIGRTMDAALQETAETIDLPEFQFFVIALAIQRETGGNLAETMSNLSNMLRQRAQMKLKIRAMSSEAKASAWIVGLLPFMVFGLISVMNPSYTAGFFTNPALIIAGLGGLGWMGIGVFIMARMVKFEI